MKRLVFPVIIAALSLCHEVNAQNGSRVYMTRMPNTLLASQTNQAGAVEAVSPPIANGYGAMDPGYGFGSNKCGCSSGCCDDAWSGYTRSCGIFGKHQGCHSGCATNCCGCGGGGCFGNSFAGGCGGCGGGWGHHGCGCGHGCGLIGLFHHCKGLFHGHGMFSSCDTGCGASYGSSCGCGNGSVITNGDKSGLSAPPMPPAEAPATNGAPTAAPVPEKSAYRSSHVRTFGSW